MRALQKDPADAGELEVLRKAFIASTEESEAIIQRMVEQGSGESLLRARSEYIKLERESNLIHSLPNSLSNQFYLINYAPNVEELTLRASEKLFFEGEQLLASGNKDDARIALTRFNSIKQINPQFPEINRWIRDAEALAITKIQISIQDASKYKLKDTLTSYLEGKKLKDLNDKWLLYGFNHKIKDGEVKIKIHKIGLESSTSDTKTHTFEKELQIPEYVLDAHGNVKKDANGNDMKKYTTKKVQAEVVEETLNHELVLRGTMTSLNYYTNEDIKSEDLVKKESIRQTIFQVKGDAEAIDPAMLKKIEESKKNKKPQEKEWVQKEIDNWNSYLFQKIKTSKKFYQ